MHRAIGLSFLAISFIGLTGTAVHADTLDDCIGASECVGVLIPLALVAMVATGAITLAAANWARGPRDAPETPSELPTEWRAAVAREDGTIVKTNALIAPDGASAGSIGDLLSPMLGITPQQIYRQSQRARSQGLAIASFREGGTAMPALLSCQVCSNGQMLWQVIPQGSFSALLEDSGSLLHASAPYGYARFAGLEPATTNDLFDDIFAPEAIDELRERIDEGIFAAGRLTLPGVDGRQRLALAALKTDRFGAEDTHEVFLFIPDTETAEHVSASETLEAIPISLLHLDIEGRVFWANAQARQMLGAIYHPDCRIDELVQPLGRSVQSLMEEARGGREARSGEMMRLRDLRAERFVQVSLTHVLVQGRPSLMAVLTDASEIRSLEDRFAQSQKMEAIGKLAGGVAHDFNNVLTAISGHCDLLLLRKDAIHPDFNDLTQIKLNSNRAANMVKHLLAFSRKQTLQPRLLSIQDVVSDTLYLLDRLIGETITLTIEHGRDLGSVRADNQQLEQALMNLVVNARDAMKEGGSIVIGTRNRRLTTEQQQIGVTVPAGEYVEISVTDSGTGIEPGVIDKVFDPFFTTKPQGEGTGLGLSTVYGIVKQSGGYIYVENLPNSGARFTILLPRAKAEEADPKALQAQEPAQQRDLTGQGAVMLVEDEAPVRSFASRALKLRGYRVVEAESAEEAIDILSTGNDAVDVLVSDVVMPGMDGPTFATEARKLRPGIKVIFISGYAEDSFRRNLSDFEFHFLPKPFSLNELTAKVKMALDGQSS